MCLEPFGFRASGVDWFTHSSKFGASHSTKSLLEMFILDPSSKKRKKLSMQSEKTDVGLVYSPP